MKSIAEQNNTSIRREGFAYVGGTAARKLERRAAIISFDAAEIARKDLRCVENRRPKHQAKQELSLGEYLVSLAKVWACYIAFTAIGMFIVLI